MAKRKARTKNEGMAQQMEYRPPSTKEQIKMASEHVARVAMENHPKMKKMHDEITRSVQSAVGKHLGSGRMKTPSD
mgnify:CR=1 FL=1